MDEDYKTQETEEPEGPIGEQPPASERRMNDDGSPEPPSNWKPEETEQKVNSVREAFELSNVETMATVGKTTLKLKGSEITDFKSGRNYFLAAVIASIASLFFGGIILSGVAIICAIASRGRFNNVASRHAGEPEVQTALARSGNIALAVAISILVLNIIALIVFYPVVADMMQSGDLNLFGGSSTTSGTSTGNGTWG